MIEPQPPFTPLSCQQIFGNRYTTVHCCPPVGVGTQRSGSAGTVGSAVTVIAIFGAEPPLGGANVGRAHAAILAENMAAIKILDARLTGLSNCCHTPPRRATIAREEYHLRSPSATLSQPPQLHLLNRRRSRDGLTTSPPVAQHLAFRGSSHPTAKKSDNTHSGPPATI